MDKSKARELLEDTVRELRELESRRKALLNLADALRPFAEFDAIAINGPNVVVIEAKRSVKGHASKRETAGSDVEDIPLTRRQMFAFGLEKIGRPARVKEVIERLWQEGLAVEFKDDPERLFNVFTSILSKSDEFVSIQRGVWWFASRALPAGYEVGRELTFADARDE